VRPQVVYIMGAGRSGSTVLGVVLGNCKRVFYAGELDAWLFKEGCSNFDGPERATFWEAIATAVPEGAELYGTSARRYIEHSVAPARALRGKRKLRRRYRHVAEHLYQALGERSGAAWIVDTSHYPLRAREMQKVNGIDLYLLFLSRRPESVVSSFSKRDVDQPARSPLRTNAYLHLTNLLAMLVFLAQPSERRLFLRYEEFAKHPERTVEELLKWLQMDTEVPDLTELHTGLAFQGNRLLRSKHISFRRSEPEASPKRLFTTVAQLPWTILLARLSPRLPDSDMAKGLGARRKAIGVPGQ
jgi:Sulfotransferase family